MHGVDSTMSENLTEADVGVLSFLLAVLEA